MNVIETRELSRTFGRRAAVVSLDLEVRAGEIYGFLGPNGAGKTTTIRMLTGILPPSGGTARIVGYDIRTDPGAVRARIGLLPESTGYYGWMTPVEYLGFFAQLYGIRPTETTPRILTLLEWVGLSERRAGRIATFSRGMRAPLGVARALINRPRVVFLDEPMLGLDPLGQRDVLELIRRENRDEGTTMFLSSHALTQVGQLCTRVGILDEGRLVAGTASKLSQRLKLPAALRLTVTDPARAQQAVAHLGPSHLVVVPRDQALPAEVLVRALDRAGVIVRDVTVDTPNLEDVLFALVWHKRDTR